MKSCEPWIDICTHKCDCSALPSLSKGVYGDTRCGLKLATVVLFCGFNYCSEVVCGCADIVLLWCNWYYESVMSLYIVKLTSALNYMT